jgi:hypothetical protein
MKIVIFILLKRKKVLFSKKNNLPHEIASLGDCTDPLEFDDVRVF